MSKLLEDPKVATLVEREVNKAVKATKREVLDLVKIQAAQAKELEDKAVKKEITTTLKDLTTQIREIAA